MDMDIVDEESFGIIPLAQQNGVWKVFLILHRGGRHWAFPKGHSNPGETPVESAIRELKEETGLDIERFLQDTPFVETYKFFKKTQMVTKRVSYYPAIVSGKLRLQVEEIQQGAWLTFPEALQLLSFKEARSICTQVLDLLK